MELANTFLLPIGTCDIVATTVIRCSVLQSELELNDKRKETVATSHENPKLCKRIGRVPCFVAKPSARVRVLATSGIILLRSEDTVFTRCVYCFLLRCLSFLFISSSGGGGSISMST